MIVTHSRSRLRRRSAEVCFLHFGMRWIRKIVSQLFAWTDEPHPLRRVSGNSCVFWCFAEASAMKCATTHTHTKNTAPTMSVWSPVLVSIVAGYRNRCVSNFDTCSTPDTSQSRQQQHSTHTKTLNDSDLMVRIILGACNERSRTKKHKCRFERSRGATSIVTFPEKNQRKKTSLVRTHSAFLDLFWQYILHVHVGKLLVPTLHEYYNGRFMLIKWPDGFCISCALWAVQHNVSNSRANCVA